MIRSAVRTRTFDREVPGRADQCENAIEIASLDRSSERSGEKGAHHARKIHGHASSA